MISVIMPTYNRENMFRRMIESVLSQTFRDFEFVIVDNGSTDHSGDIAEQYALRDDRVRVFHRLRGNVGSGYNAGLDVAVGDFVAFVDDDDYLEPTYLEYLYQLICKYSADIAVCGSWREIKGVRQPKFIFEGVYSYESEAAIVEMLKREKFNVAPPTKLIARRLFDNLRFHDTKKYCDVDFTYKLLASAERIVVSGKPLYTFVRHGNNASLGTTEGETVPSEQIRNYLEIFEERTRWLTDKYPDQAGYWLYTELSYALSMYDKTADPDIKMLLKEKLQRNAGSFLSAKSYYTKRDKLLVERYGNEIQWGQVV